MQIGSSWNERYSVYIEVICKYRPGVSIDK